MSSDDHRKVLLLSVGYGEGHHAAALAAAEEFERRGWETLRLDICEERYPRFFRLTQQFYHFCVRRAPWLWGITYARADKADWAEAVRRPPLNACCAHLAKRIREFSPSAIVCTYPLFALMVDVLREQGTPMPPCYVVVTDSLEISRPWMVSGASLIFLPDEYSARQLCQRYALQEGRMRVSGFPVRPDFREHGGRCLPTPKTLRVVYGAYAPQGRVLADIRGLFSLFPGAQVTVLAGERAPLLRRELAAERAAFLLEVLERTEEMPALFAASHLYIGKAGAATMYEAYSAELPCIVNYALPGQEQGNLRLLLLDGAGICVESTSELLRALDDLLRDGAAGWAALAAAMHRAARSHGAERLVDMIEQDVEQRSTHENTHHPAG